MEAAELVALSAKEAIWDAVPVRRCKTCERWFPETEEHFQRGSSGYLVRACHKCRRAANRARYQANRAERLRQQREYRERRMRDPERAERARMRHREWMRVLRARAQDGDADARARLRRWARNYQRRIHNDPALLETHRANQRMDYHRRAREKGVRHVPARSKRGIDVEREEARLLPIAPLRQYLLEELEWQSIPAAAMAHGLDVRSLRRLLTEQEMVRFDTVDRMLSHTNISVEELYPEEASL